MLVPCRLGHPKSPSPGFFVFIRFPCCLSVLDDRVPCARVFTVDPVYMWATGKFGRSFSPLTSRVSSKPLHTRSHGQPERGSCAPVPDSLDTAFLRLLVWFPRHSVADRCLQQRPGDCSRLVCVAPFPSGKAPPVPCLHRVLHLSSVAMRVTHRCLRSKNLRQQDLDLTVTCQALSRRKLQLPCSALTRELQQPSDV